MLTGFRLNRPGVGQQLKEFGSALEPYAERAAAHVRRQHPDADVIIEEYTTDRAARAVVVRDHRAQGWQAKYGTLSRAASAAGLPFSPPKRGRR